MSDWAADYEVPSDVLRIEAYEWWCQDEDCDCTEPRIEAIRANPRVGLPWIERERLWTGTFRTHGETGGRTELNREAARLRRHHNAIFHRIE